MVFISPEDHSHRRKVGMMNPNAYQQMLMQFMQNYPNQNQPIRTEIIRVNGKNGADALLMAPNSSIFVADNTNADRIWLCMTDGAGYKTVRGIKCTFEEESDVDIQSVENRLQKLEEAVNEISTRNAKRKPKEEYVQQELQLSGSVK
jgi:uncharacterized protein HemX